MTPSLVLYCPNCKRRLEAHSWHDDSSGECRLCGVPFEFIAFPGLTAAAERIMPHAAELAADSVCFFHAQNRAESVCEGCGRLLCAVCAVPFMGRKLCPVCIAAATKSDPAPEAVRGRVLHDRVALAIAVLPLLVYVFTLITAPVAVGWVVFAWNKPGSLVGGRSRWRLAVAALFAVAEIAGWVWLFTARRLWR